MSDLIFGPSPEERYEEEGLPAFRVIARMLRDQITSGALVDGEKLPSLAELCRRFEVSEITARRAIQQLRSEGLVVGVRGKGSYVRRLEQLERAMPFRHWRDASTEGGRTYDREAATAGRTVAVDHQTDHATAEPAVAGRLGIEPDDPVVRTRYLITMDDQPVSMSTCWEPLSLTGGTVIEHPHDGPHATEGIVARFGAIGLHVHRVQELLDVGRPTAAERRALRVPEDVPVIRIEQTFFAGIDDDQAVQTADITYAADRYKFRYDMEIK